jgi:hypothetical protein
MSSSNRQGFLRDDTTGALIVGDASSSPDRYLMPTGALAETMSRRAATLSDVASSLASGTLQLVGLPLAAGTIVTSASFVAGATPAAVPTNQWACLVQPSDLSVLAKSADLLTAAWAANAVQTFTFTPYTITTSGLYYLGLMVAAGTPPTLRALNNGSGTANIAPRVSARSTTGLTTPASLGATAAALSTSAVQPYAYVS